MVEHDDIKYDYILNKKEFEKFEEQHKQMRVDVKVGSTFIAADHAKELPIDANGERVKELGIWKGTYCAHCHFSSDDEKDTRITLYRKTGNNDDKDYQNCLYYFNNLWNDERLKSLHDITKEADKEPLRDIQKVTEELASKWDEYVGSDVLPEGSFLDTVIQRRFGL